jgi:hypothetical protein
VQRPRPARCERAIESERGSWPRDRVQVLHAYELAGFAMQLMHEGGGTALDQWLSDFVETDWRYVEGY